MREKFNCPKRKKTRNNIFFVLAAFLHISTRQAEQKSRVLFVCLNQLARNARVSGKKNYVGEEKKYIGHILKYKAHISKYVRHIFQLSRKLARFLIWRIFILLCATAATQFITFVNFTLYIMTGRRKN